MLCYIVLLDSVVLGQRGNELLISVLTLNERWIIKQYDLASFVWFKVESYLAKLIRFFDVRIYKSTEPGLNLD